jgi:phosphopantothenoylcysteine synthetase/decarboxylase
MKILVTAGGTKEYIDGVRYIGNSSSGKTGADLSDYLSQLGHEVLWLGATSAVKPKGPAKQLQYETFDELASGLKSYLASQHVDLVFQAAAVSDFKVSAVELDGKVFKTCRDVKLPTADEVKLVLVKQPKLVSSLKSWSKNANLKVVAFKLTNSPESQVRTEAVAKLIQQSGIDWVAHNDLQEITAEKHAFQLYQALDEHMTCQDICQLADAVIEQVGEHL